jgi:hypothetical protein
MYWSVPLCTLEFPVDFWMGGGGEGEGKQCGYVTFDASSINYLGKWEGVGPWKSRLFWALNGTRLTARCHFTGPKKVSISMAQPPPMALKIITQV